MGEFTWLLTGWNLWYKNITVLKDTKLAKCEHQIQLETGELSF